MGRDEQTNNKQKKQTNSNNNKNTPGSGTIEFQS
jgi:hypothetical protein